MPVVDLNQKLRRKEVELLSANREMLSLQVKLEKLCNKNKLLGSDLENSMEEFKMSCGRLEAKVFCVFHCNY